MQRLRLPRASSTVSLIGVGAQKSNQSKGVTSFTLKPHFKSQSTFLVSAYILPKLTTFLPCNSLDKRSWPHLTELQLADNEFHTPGSIDIIMGADIYAQIIEEGIIKADRYSLIAQRSKLGWILSRPSGTTALTNTRQGYHVCCNGEFHDLLRRFWESEEVPSKNASSLSSQDQECE